MLPPIGNLLLGNAELQPTGAANIKPKPSSSFGDKLLTHQQVADASVSPKRAVDHTAATTQQNLQSQVNAVGPTQSSAVVAAVAESLKQERKGQSLPNELPPSGNRLPQKSTDALAELAQRIPLTTEQQTRHEHLDFTAAGSTSDPWVLGKYAVEGLIQNPSEPESIQTSDQEVGNYDKNNNNNEGVDNRLLFSPNSTYQGLELGMPKGQVPSGDQVYGAISSAPTATETINRDRLVQLGLLASGSRLAADAQSNSSATPVPKLPSSAVAVSKDLGAASSGSRADSGVMMPGLLAAGSIRTGLESGSLGSQVQAGVVAQNQTIQDGRGLGSSVPSTPTSSSITSQEVASALAAARSLSEASGSGTNPAMSSPGAEAMAPQARTLRTFRDEIVSMKPGEVLPAKYANRLDSTAQSAAAVQAAPQLAPQLARQMMPAQMNQTLPSAPNQPDASASLSSLGDQTSGSNTSANPLLGSVSSAAGLGRGSGVESALPSGLVPFAQGNRLDVADGLNGAWVGRLSQMIAQQQLTGQSLRIALSPAELGAVEITFNGASDNWSVSLSAQQGQTRELLDAHLERIRSLLQDMGHRDAQVSLANRWTGAETGANQQQFQDSQGRSSASGSWQHSPAVGTQESAATSRASASSSSSSAHGVDAYV